MNSSWSSPSTSPPLSPVALSRSVSVTLSHADSQAGGSPRSRGANGVTHKTAAQKRSKYLRRLIRFRHMDFEYALWQMLYLFISPQKVYRNFQYRKQSRDQWARDDPAFLVLLAICMITTTLVFSLTLGFGIFETMKFLLWVVLVDCVGVGVTIATLFWGLTNRLLRPASCPPDLDVEWGYAFDVHLNAFFPLLMILHFLQLPFLYPVILYHPWFFAPLLGNTFWLVAVLYYVYITFLGYNCLQFLRRTQILLYPMTVMVLIYIFSLIFQWNFTQMLWDFYYYRVR